MWPQLLILMVWLFNTRLIEGRKLKAGSRDWKQKRWRNRHLNVNLPSENILSRMSVGKSFTPTSVSFSSDFPTDAVPCSAPGIQTPKKKPARLSAHIFTHKHTTWVFWPSLVTRGNLVGLGNCTHQWPQTDCTRYPGGPLTNPAPTSSQ